MKHRESFDFREFGKNQITNNVFITAFVGKARNEEVSMPIDAAGLGDLGNRCFSKRIIFAYFFGLSVSG